MNVRTIGYWLMAAISLAVSLAGFNRSRRKSADLCKAAGVVVGAQESDQDVNVWVPVIRFTTADGKLVEFIERGYSQSRRPVGRRVVVLYSAMNPRYAML